MFLEVKAIDTFYGIFQAIFQVSLDLDQGEVVSLLGRNGAGKSTTLKSIVGLCRPSAGSVRFKGEEICGKKPFQIARMGIGFVPENRWIFSELTVKENLDLGLRKRERQSMTDALEKVYGLFPKLKTMENPRCRNPERRRAADADRGTNADGEPRVRARWMNRPQALRRSWPSFSGIRSAG